MAINKVEFGGQTLIDLTEDTVTPSTLMAGETAHDRSGAAIVGTATGGSSTLAQLTDVNLTNLSDEQIIKYNSTTQKWENADAGGSDIVHLTKAEYDALPNTKLSDNKIYMLEDVPSSDTEDKHIILDSEDVVYPQRSFLQFTGDANIVDDETNDKTIVDITGGGAEIEEMTQAEYDALPNTKLTDGVLRAIKDEYSPADSKLVGLGDCYSTSERQIGCWKDGKPLYQKTFVYDCTNTSNVQEALDCGSLEEIKVTKDAYFINSLGDIVHTWWVNVNFWEYLWEATSGHYKCLVKRNTSYSEWQSSVKFVCTYQYTKTTDAAGSGNWTPSGVPAAHYSTSEQVVGTWVTGKPLYQKTVDIGSLPSNDTKTVAHGVADLNLIVSCKGFAYNSSYTFLSLPSINVDSLTYGVQLESDRTNITVKTKESWMNVYSGFVTIQYTKTTD